MTAPAAKKPRGGPRPGSGRKRNAPNKATAERQRRVAESGPTPHEVQITRMRFYLHMFGLARQGQAKAGKMPDGRVVTATLVEFYLDKAGEAADAAAPYVHPRLSAIALHDLQAMQQAQENAAKQIDATPGIDYDDLTDEKLAELYRQKVGGSPEL